MNQPTSIISSLILCSNESDIRSQIFNIVEEIESNGPTYLIGYKLTKN